MTDMMTIKIKAFMNESWYIQSLFPCNYIYILKLKPHSKLIKNAFS